MSYSSRVRYTSRRDKNKNLFQKFKWVILFAILAMAVLIYKNRVVIKDHLATYFM